MGAAPAVGQAVDVSQQRPGVRHQVMRQQHRLGPLEVRVARQAHRVTVDAAGQGSVGPIGEHVDEAENQLGGRRHLAHHVVAERGGDLVVARPAGVDLAADRADQLGDPAFDGGVDVLVGGDEVEHAGPVLHLDRVQATEEGGQLPLVDEARPVQTPDVRLGAGDVVGQETLVVAERLGELDERLGGRDVEPTVPELAPIGGRAVLGHRCEPGPWTSDQVCTPRPQMRTKPSESAWRNRSAAS